MRRDTWDPWDSCPPPQRHSDPEHQLHGAVARAVRSRTPLCRETRGPMSETGLAHPPQGQKSHRQACMLWGQTAFLIVSHSPTLVKVQVPLRKVKLPCGLAVSKGGGLSPGWGKTKASGCSGLPSVPSGAGLSLSGHGRCRAGPTQSRPGRAALRSASGSPPRRKAGGHSHEQVSRR